MSACSSPTRLCEYRWTQPAIRQPSPPLSASQPETVAKAADTGCSTNVMRLCCLCAGYGASFPSFLRTFNPCAHSYGICDAFEPVYTCMWNEWQMRHDVQPVITPRSTEEGVQQRVCVFALFSVFLFSALMMRL